jgi:1-acyl-sn-glycerol-3-phosphate acyltransferase
MTPDREPLISLILYRLLKWIVFVPMLRLYCRGRVYGRENVPKRGRVIVVANHASDFDPPFVAISVHRPVAFMAKQELFSIPLLGPGIRLYGAYPVNRESPDRSAIRSAIEQINTGWAIGLFIQGTRTPDGRIPSPKLGAAMIAAKTQTPLLPVSIWGTHEMSPKGAKFPRPVPVTIRIGELISPPTSTKREELEAVTQQCVDTIHAMHDLKR